MKTKPKKTSYVTVSYLVDSDNKEFRELTYNPQLIDLYGVKTFLEGILAGVKDEIENGKS